MRIKNTRELIARRYYSPTLENDVEAYVKSSDVYLALKAVRHNLYNDLQSLPIPTHWWKELFMDFIIGHPISAN